MYDINATAVIHPKYSCSENCILLLQKRVALFSGLKLISIAWFCWQSSTNALMKVVRFVISKMFETNLLNQSKITSDFEYWWFSMANISQFISSVCSTSSVITLLICHSARYIMNQNVLSMIPSLFLNSPVTAQFSPPVLNTSSQLLGYTIIEEAVFFLIVPLISFERNWVWYSMQFSESTVLFRRRANFCRFPLRFPALYAQYICVPYTYGNILDSFWQHRYLTAAYYAWKLSLGTSIDLWLSIECSFYSGWITISNISADNSSET